MAIDSISDHIQSIDQQIHNTYQEFRVKNCVLESYRFLPDGNDAICKVRDVNTKSLRQALASKLIAINFGKDAYLLELLRGGD